LGAFVREASKMSAAQFHFPDRTWQRRWRWIMVNEIASFRSGSKRRHQGTPI
jgi:hypothetical protein